MELARNPACNPACKACHYKSYEYEDQLRRKQDWALTNLGKWASVLQPIRPAPEAERLAYRSKSWLRSSFADGTLSFGMYRAIQVGGKWEPEFVAWDTCPIHVVAIQEMIARLREILPAQAAKFCENSLFGIWMGSPHIVLVARDQEIESLRAIDWSKVLRAPFDRVWLHRTTQVGKRIFQNDEFELLYGAPPDREHPILAFRQVAQTLLADARALAVRSLMAANPELVVDLYCGTGELARLLPSSVGWLGIEASKSAAEYAGGLREKGAVPHEAYTGMVEDRLRDRRVREKIRGRYALYVNPPRSGTSPEVMAQLSELLATQTPERVIFLSCSASSLARDLEPFLTRGYHLELLQPYDFFPQTEHFETVAVLSSPSV